MYCKQAVIAMKVLLHSKYYCIAINMVMQALLRCNKASSDSNASIIACIAMLAKKSQIKQESYG